MAETVRVVEGVPEEEIEDCPACGGGSDLSQYYPRRTGEGGNDVAKSRLAKILPLAPDVIGVVKTAAVAGVSMQVNARITEEILSRLDPRNRLGDMGGQVAAALIALVSGGLVAQFTRQKALGVAWAIGPVANAVSGFAANVIGGTGVSGLHSTVGMPSLSPDGLPSGVRLPYSGSEAALSRIRAAGAGM